MIRVLLLSAALLPAAPAGARACLTAPEAEAIALVAIPEVIRHTGTVCADRLPAASLVRRTDSALLRKYDAAAEVAWPVARAAIGKLSDPMVETLLQSSYARPLLATLAAPLVVGRVSPEDCGTIDRLVAGLEPLPPRNAAGVMVTALQFLRSEKTKGKAIDLPDLPLCEAPR